MVKGKIFILSGPSGSGKTTLHQKLLASPRLRNRLAKSISVTTRPKRKGERHGRDYMFVSPRMFRYKKRSGHFLESEEVFGNFYGTPLNKVRQLLRQGKNVLLCIDVKGARTVRRKYPQAITLFVKAPSFAVLAQRLQGRGSEHQDIVRQRLRTAKRELKEAVKYDYVIVNDNLNKAYRQLEGIVQTEID